MHAQPCPNRPGPPGFRSLTIESEDIRARKRRAGRSASGSRRPSTFFKSVRFRQISSTRQNGTMRHCLDIGGMCRMPWYEMPLHQGSQHTLVAQMAAIKGKELSREERTGPAKSPPNSVKESTFFTLMTWNMPPGVLGLPLDPLASS